MIHVNNGPEPVYWCDHSHTSNETMVGCGERCCDCGAIRTYFGESGYGKWSEPTQIVMMMQQKIKELFQRGPSPVEMFFDQKDRIRVLEKERDDLQSKLDVFTDMWIIGDPHTPACTPVHKKDGAYSIGVDVGRPGGDHTVVITITNGAVASVKSS